MAELMTWVIVVPYTEDHIAREVEFFGPFAMEYPDSDMADMVMKRYGKNVHWQLRAILDWERVLPHIKDVINGAVKGKHLDHGSVLATEGLITYILQNEGKKVVEKVHGSEKMTYFDERPNPLTKAGRRGV